MNGTSHDEHDADEPTIHWFIDNEEWATAGLMAANGTEIDTRFMSASAAAEFELALSPGLRLLATYRKWIVVKEEDYAEALAELEEGRRCAELIRR